MSSINAPSGRKPLPWDSAFRQMQNRLNALYENPLPAWTCCIAKPVQRELLNFEKLSFSPSQCETKACQVDDSRCFKSSQPVKKKKINASTCRETYTSQSGWNEVYFGNIFNVLQASRQSLLANQNKKLHPERQNS